MSAAFDTHRAVRRLETAGIETRQAEAIVSEVRDAAGASRGALVTRGEFYRALWIHGGAIVAILAALRFLPV